MSVPGFSREALEEGIFRHIQDVYPQLTADQIRSVRVSVDEKGKPQVIEERGAAKLPEFLVRSISRGVAYEVYDSIANYLEALGIVAPVGSDERDGVVLAGVVNGVNQVFTTPDKFVHVTPGRSIKIFFNGSRLTLGVDYALSESGGVGTGYDTVTLLRPIAPMVGDLLISDYTKAL